MKQLSIIAVVAMPLLVGCADRAANPTVKPDAPEPPGQRDKLVFDAESHDRVFQEATDLIWPYIQLHGVDPKDPATEEGSKQIHDGIEKLKAVIDFNPTNYGAHWVTGKAYQALEDHEQAYSSLQLAYALEPDNPDVARELMHTCLALGKGKEAVKVAQHAASLRPEDSGLEANLALALLVAGRVDDALATAQSALDRSPDDEITKTLLGVITDVKDGKRDRPTRWPEQVDTPDHSRMDRSRNTSRVRFAHPRQLPARSS
jgi:hypothetical protein